MMLSNGIFKSILVLCLLITVPSAFGVGKRSDGDSFVDTGSFGDFTPRAFLQAEQNWTIFRAVGSYDKNGFPCDSNGGSCSVKKDYRFESVTPQEQSRVAEIGVGWPLFTVKRSAFGTLRTMEMRKLDNTTFLRLDQIRSSGLLGVEGAFSTSIQRIDKRGPEPLGQIEGRDTAWSATHPSSYYYMEDQKPVFGLTSVSDMMIGGLVQNAFTNNPGKRRLLGGTFWCQSDEWSLAEGVIDPVLKNDNFDMEACRGTKVMTSETKKDVKELAGNFFFNRVDSRVTLHNRDDYQYEVQTNREWICPFDCDGSVYQIFLPGQNDASIAITSDRRTWTSSTLFKIKIVMVDWDKDGMPLEVSNADVFGANIDLRDIVDSFSTYKDIVAVIVSEMKDTQSMDWSGNGNYTQHTYIALPPRVYSSEGEGVPAAYKDGLAKFVEDIEPRKGQQMIQVAYQLKVLDSIFAMMPDQLQTSPELADAEEKLDELMAFWRFQLTGDIRSITPDLAFDINSEIDSTTATSWTRPGSQAVKGKADWMLDSLMAR